MRLAPEELEEMTAFVRWYFTFALELKLRNLPSTFVELNAYIFWEGEENNGFHSADVSILLVNTDASLNCPHQDSAFEHLSSF